MLNKEKYAKEIAEIAVNNETIALKDNKPISCREIHCIDCEQNVHGYGCSMKKLTEWANSEYKEPVLTEEEKEYLSSVIKPFRKDVEYIVKLPKFEWIQETIYIHIGRSWRGNIELPTFKKGAMYKGMKIDKRYTLEELGL